MLYVGVVLIVNGIWLIGTAYAAAAAARRPGDGDRGCRGLCREGDRRGGCRRAGTRRGAVVASPRRNAEATPLFIQNREVAVLNIFTGFVGLAVATHLHSRWRHSHRIPAEGLPSIRPAAPSCCSRLPICGWRTTSTPAPAGGRSAGTACSSLSLRSAGFTRCSPRREYGATVAGYQLVRLGGALGMFWALLTLELPIARITGSVAIIEGIGTLWALAIAILEGKLAF